MALTPAWKNLEGMWLVQREENMDAYLKELGINWLFRKMAKAASIYVNVVVKEGGLIQMQAVTKPTIIEQPVNDFRVDGPETVVIVNGLKHRAVTKWHDGKLITSYSQSEDGSVPASKITRQIVNGELDQVSSFF